MSPTRLPQLGSVVWAELEDANGFRKVRPAVVVTAPLDDTIAELRRNAEAVECLWIGSLSRMEP